MDAPELELRVKSLQRLLYLTLLLALVPWCVIAGAAYYLTQARIELPGTLSARSIELRAESGETLAEIGAFPKLGGALRLRNAEGREVVYLGGEPAGGGNLSLHAKDGKILVVARDNELHHGSVTTFGADEKVLAFLGVGVRGDGVLQTWNASGATIGVLGTNQVGEPLLQLLAKDGHTAFEVGTRAEGQTDIVLYGPDAKAGATLAAEAQGGRLGLFDVRGGERVRAGCCKEHDNASLDVTDASGGKVLTLGENHDNPGGFIRAYSPGEHPAFYGGVDDQDGSGRISLYHPSGTRLFAACEAEDKLGCIVYTSAIDGTLTFIAPEQPLGGK